MKKKFKSIMLVFIGIMFSGCVVYVLHSNLASVQTYEITNYVERRTDSIANEHYEIIVNGKKIEQEYSKELGDNDELMLPLRFIAEEIGYEVSWDPNNNIVGLEKGRNKFNVAIGGLYYVYGDTMPLNIGTNPYLKIDRIYVPSSFISDVFKVQIQESGDNVHIKTK